jgi:hypothetical protein
LAGSLGNEIGDVADISFDEDGRLATERTSHGKANKLAPILQSRTSRIRSQEALASRSESRG